MTLDKDFCRSFGVNGWRFMGYWDGFYRYEKQLTVSRWVHVRATEDDLTESPKGYPANIVKMLERGLSR